MIDNYVPLYHDVPPHTPDRNDYDLPEKMPQAASHISDSMIEVVSMLDEVGRPSTKIAMDGMGRLPDNISSVSSLLLFNTNENPYKNYSHLDNLLGKEGKERPTTKKRIGAQPESFIKGDSMIGGAALNFNYKPALGNVPTLELPTSLPGLSDVADVSLSNMELPSIAPSTDAIFNLPDLLPNPGSSSASAAASATPSASGTAPPPPPPPASDGDFAGALPPPPPPPPPGAFGSDPSGDFAGALPPPPPPPPPMAAFDAPPPPPPPPAMTAAPPPPPPPQSFAPPPPPPQTYDEQDDDAGFEELAARTNPEPVAPVMDLFSQIRENQKSRLRKFDAAQAAEAAKPVAPPPGDMFGNLLHGLEMRRKAIKEDSDDEADEDW
eukprot:TRINITY_DN2343_c0_g1_i1.p1 TRINITY_DN2343_c0_g1~~TRINITY_DN2343_c0_g1_i1.p1  ORF type:complete len:380 (-),score=102.53 TRINITY_DN2343_c0_g1_i1:114-1253(-)